MAISKEKKQSQVEALVSDFRSAKMTVVTDYKGLTVAEMQDLRKQLKEQGGNYRIVKNTLIAIAAKDAFGEVNTEVLSGPVALAFGNDEVAPAQVIARFAKQSEALEIKGAIAADGAILNADQVKQLATLPSKEQLRAQLVGTIAAPVSGFVNVMAGNLRGLVQVLNAVASK